MSASGRRRIVPTNSPKKQAFYEKLDQGANEDLDTTLALADSELEFKQIQAKNKAFECAVLSGLPGDDITELEKTMMFEGMLSQQDLLLYLEIREIGRAVQQECRDRSRMPSSA
eukprot:TRINITY_DN61258_c0_g1_i3.p1 TRINITY_DN61258_c0_g1~~TRINITY_DN61258_c0_g1_i3.p1  ORF type:complete len:114 (-),score=23.98 TRINITY_DN61258_c0_g1_i3:10-351(-)